MILNLDHQVSNSPVLNLDAIPSGIELRLNDSITTPSLEIQTFQWPVPAGVQNISIPWTGLGLFVLVITSGGVIWIASHAWHIKTSEIGFLKNILSETKDEKKPVEPHVPPPQISQQEPTQPAQIPMPEPAVSQAPAPVPQIPTVQTPTVPIHNPGDSYTLVSINLDNGTVNNTTERKVVLASFEKVVVESRNLASKSVAQRQLEFTPEWNVVATRNSGSGLNYSPPLKYYEFPLTPGKTWQQTSIETNTKTGATREHTLSATIGDWETVTVPAGTFRGVKVTIQTELFDRTTGQKTTGIDTSWYVSEVRRSVRSLTSSRSPAGVQSRQDIQLIKYNLTK